MQGAFDDIEVDLGRFDLRLHRRGPSFPVAKRAGEVRLLNTRLSVDTGNPPRGWEKGSQPRQFDFDGRELNRQVPRRLRRIDTKVDCVRVAVPKQKVDLPIGGRPVVGRKIPRETDRLEVREEGKNRSRFGDFGKRLRVGEGVEVVQTGEDEAAGESPNRRLTIPGEIELDLAGNRASDRFAGFRIDRLPGQALGEGFFFSIDPVCSRIISSISSAFIDNPEIRRC